MKKGILVKKLLIMSLVVLFLLAILAQWSYTSTYRRTYGAFNPFVLDIHVSTSENVPIAGAQARISNLPEFFIEARPERSAADGHLLLIHMPQGIEWEYEERYLFWLIRIGDQPPPLYDGYLELQAPGYMTVQIPLRDVFKQQDGIQLFPEEQRELPRYPVSVTLRTQS